MWWVFRQARGESKVEGAMAIGLTQSQRRREFWLPVLTAGALLAGALLATPAAGQSQSAAARTLFREGRTLLDAGRVDEACPKFEESLRLDPGIGTQFNLAHCWERQGRLASAWALFLDVASAASASGQKARAKAARERAEALEPRLPRLRIDWSGAPEGATLTRDGEPVGRASWSTAIPVDPGTHIVQATAPGKLAWSHEVSVGSDSGSVVVTVPALSAPPPAVAASAQNSTLDSVNAQADAALERRAQTNAESGMSGRTLTSLVIGGVGVASLAVGGVFLLQSRDDNGEAEKLCTLPAPLGNTCGSDAELLRHEGLINDAKSGQTRALAAFGVGTGALAIATMLYLTGDDSSDESPERVAVQVLPALAPDEFGAVLRGQF